MENLTKRDGFEVLEEDEYAEPNPFLLDLASGLHWVGLAIIAIFIVDFSFKIIPLSPLDPKWLQKISGILMSNGVTPLIGAIFILVAPLADPDSEMLARNAWFVRQLSTFAAIGYLSLIPIQIYSGIGLVSIEKRSQEDVINRVQEAVKDIERSTTESQLRDAYALVPGKKPIIGDQFLKPVEEVRDQLLDQIKPNIKRIEVVYKERIILLWKQWTIILVQNCMRLVILFLGFAAMGYLPSSNYTMLEFILQIFKRPRKAKTPPMFEAGEGEWMEEQEL